MSLKRSYSGESSPTKRTKHASSPKTPGRATPATPYTPYPLQPSDSPSNPFKRTAKFDGALPEVTSFSKHVALRLQLHRRGLSPIGGGVHRVVQVPLNYTFAHLRALIAWLFDMPAKYASNSARGEEYLFEAKTKVVMESMLFKPGVVRSGVTSVKVSNVRDPWHARYGRGADEEDELTEEEEESEVEAESDDWVWADEDEYTLGHLWFTGVQADRAIIYHHSSTTQVHITPNASKLPRRRGKSNLPHVFAARGRVHLSPPPLPRPIFLNSILHTLSSSPAAPIARPTSTRPRTRARAREEEIILTDRDADGDTDQDVHAFSDAHPFFHSSSPKKHVETILVENSDEENQHQSDGGGDPSEDEDDNAKEDPHLRRPPETWNEPPYAFGRYLLSFFDPKGRSYDHLGEEWFEEKKAFDPFEGDDDEEEEVVVEVLEDDEEEDEDGHEETPALTNPTSSSHTASSLPPSSPLFSPHAQHTNLFPSSSSPATWHIALSLFPSSSPSRPSHLSSPSSSKTTPSTHTLDLHTPLSPKALSSLIAPHYPNTKYTSTPLPPRSRKLKMRLDRVEKRLERGKKGGWLCEYDEGVEEARKERERRAKEAAKLAKARKKTGAGMGLWGKAKWRRKEEQVEVDELAEEQEEEQEEEEDSKWKRPKNLKEGEVWDPFGDEDEL